MAMPDSSGGTFLYWLAIAGLMLLGGVLFIHFGLLALFLEQDASRLSLVILAGLIIASGHAGYRSWLMDKEFKSARSLSAANAVLSSDNPSSIAADYQERRGERPREWPKGC